MVMESLDRRMDQLETRIDEIHREVTEMKNDLKELLISLKGNAIQPGFVTEVRRDIDQLEAEVAEIRKGTLTKEQIDGIDQVMRFFRGWKMVIAGLVVVVQLAISVLLLAKEIGIAP